MGCWDADPGDQVSCDGVHWIDAAKVDRGAYRYHRSASGLVMVFGSGLTAAPADPESRPPQTPPDPSDPPAPHS